MRNLLNEQQLYTYLETYARENQLQQTITVLPYAREMHKGQYRKGKDNIPYICHPMLIACHALSLGLDGDNLISAALLHDVCEDCGVAVCDLPVNEETKHIVALLTKDKIAYKNSDKGKEAYYSAIAKNEMALMIKLLDRCNNISGMVGGFTKEKTEFYARETKEWFYPLIELAKREYPKYNRQIFLIQYHMVSVLESLIF